MRFTKIPETAFDQLQLNAGVVLSTFTPSSFSASDIQSALLGATSGGVSVSATAEFSDFGEDIDNCPVNVKELKTLDSWTITMSGTFVTLSTTLAKRLVGAADIDDTDTTLITPRNDLDSDEDFSDLWWVGDYSNENDDNTGGYVAIHMINALSTGGFQLQSGNREKGQISFEYTAHYSIEDQDKVPFEVYISAGEAA